MLSSLVCIQGCIVQMRDLNCSFTHDINGVRCIGSCGNGFHLRFHLSFDVHPGNAIELLDLEVVLVLGGNLVQLSFLKFFAFFSLDFKLLDLLKFLVNVTHLLFQALDEEVLIAFR